jgi:tetratricopeptide (TPR) repeat protein
MTHRFALALAFVFFLALSLLLFGSSVFHDFATLDDRYLVVHNLFIQGIGLRNIAYVFTHYDPELYIPFTFLSFQLNYLISGLSAWSYHLTNVLLHGANSFLVALLSWQLTKQRWIALFSGLLFCVHPLNTEAVVWVAGRKDLLAGCFALLACSSWLVAIGTRDHQNIERRWYWMSVGFFLFALLSKASIITLPIVLLYIQYTRYSGVRKEKMWKLVKILVTPDLSRGLPKLTPFFALSIIFGTIALFGKGRVVHSSTLLETLLMATKSTVFYLQQFIAPLHLNPLYPYHGTITLTSPDFFIPMIILGILISLIIYSLKYTRVIAAAFLSFFLLLAPSFLNFHKGDITFIGVDRYMYLPMIPLILLMMTGLFYVFDHLQTVWTRRGIVIVAALILVLFSVQSFLQTKLWADEELLFADALKQNPDNIPARMSLSLIYRERGEVNAQESVIQEGLKLRKYVGYHLDLASIFLAKGELEQAKEEIIKAQKLDTKHPDPYFYFASLAEVEKRPDEALENYTKAYTLDDSYTAAYLNAGAMLRDLKKDKEAEQMFRTALKWNPSFFEALMNLANLLIDHGRTSEALPLLQDAFALSSVDADVGNTLAYQLMNAGKKKEAQVVIDAVLRAHPENRTARRMKG